MYNIAICDDNEKDIRRMTQLLLEAGLEEGEVTFYAYQSGEALRDSFNKDVVYDLLILDVILSRQEDKMDGDAAAIEFRKSFPRAVLVFWTGPGLPTDITAELGTYRYLRKQYEEEGILQENLKEVVSKMRENRSEPFILAHRYGKIAQLHPQDILYIETENRGSKIHLFVKAGDNEEDIFFSDEKVAQLYQILKEHEFACPHQSHIVNLRYVARVHGKDLVFTNGKHLPVSRNRKKEFLTTLVQRTANKYKH